MEELITSSNIYCLALALPHQIFIHEVNIPTIGGVPLCVKHDEVKKLDKLKIVQNQYC